MIGTKGVVVGGWLLSVMWALGCADSSPQASALRPPTPTSQSSIPGVSVSAAVSGQASVAASASVAPSGPSVAPSASALAAPEATAVDLSRAPVILGDDGKTLAQTEDRPSVDSPAFKRRMELLFEAIQKDDPTLAHPVFFPAEAYEVVKDIKNPRADWKSRLLRAFDRTIHSYHKALGDRPEDAKFLRVDIDEDRVKWMKPGKEGNKVGYFRVTRSKIRYQTHDGETHTFELTSLISWRGEWFVVHLKGFK